MVLSIAGKERQLFYHLYRYSPKLRSVIIFVHHITVFILLIFDHIGLIKQHEPMSARPIGTEHEIYPAYHVKMPTSVGILTFISRINTHQLRVLMQEKSFIFCISVLTQNNASENVASFSHLLHVFANTID